MTIQKVFPAVTATEGAGVRIFRAIGNQYIRHLDPFLLLDHFDNANAQDYLAGFPSHPHRGFITFTYMLDGLMEHQDSMGHRGVIGPGDAQWMKAAHGVIHSEMPQQIDGRMRGFQLWINLPASEKLSTPEYQELQAAEFPVVEHIGASIKVLVGRYTDADGQTTTGPIMDSHNSVAYLDIRLQPSASFKLKLNEAQAGFVFNYAGHLRSSEHAIPARNIALLDTGETTVQAGPEGANFIVATGTRIGEPIVQHGPFVMNTREEIMQAMQDYRDGNLTGTVSA